MDINNYLPSLWLRGRINVTKYMNTTTATKQLNTAIIYIRVSSKDQLDGYSLENQEKVCRDYAKKHNLKVLRIFAEKAESAKTSERTELQAMVKFASKHQGKIAKLIVYKLDRFARNQEDHFALKVIFKKHGVEIVSATEAIANDSQGKLMEGVLAALAEFDNNVRSERTSQGMRTALENGYWVFQSPWGYVNGQDGGGNKLPVPHPDKAEVVTYIFEEYGKQIWGLRELARKVNQVFKHKSVYISAQLLTKILKNPLYYGRVIAWGIDVEGKHQPLITKDLFDKAQVLLGDGNPHKLARNRNNPDFPLRGTRCMNCGRNITGGWYKGKMGKKYAYYHCTSKKCANYKHINKNEFEKQFTTFLLKLSPQEDQLEILKEGIKLAFKKELSNFLDHNKKVEREIRKLEEQKAKCLELMLKDEELVPELKAMREELDEKIQTLRLQKQDNSSSDLDVDAAIDFAFNIIKNLPDNWEALDVIDFKLLKKILFPDNVNYTYPEFQTPNLSFIYKLKTTLAGGKNSVVARNGA